MKPIVQKLPLSENSSFVARNYATPDFEVGWHQHIEYELILFTQSSGMCFIGNYVGEFQPGDVFFLGSNLPHTFQKRNSNDFASAIVIQFRNDLWGADFMQLPETLILQQLFTVSSQGLKLHGQSMGEIASLIQQMEQESGLGKLIHLFQCLQIIGSKKEYALLSTQEKRLTHLRDKSRIDNVFQYAIDHFREPIALATVAELANMSVPAFCNYFKKTTRKTYLDFLNEIRIGYACNLLVNTELNVMEIAFDSGFNSIANFNRQFLKYKNQSPTHFRKQFKHVG